MVARYKMPMLRCALRQVRHPSCVLVYSLCFATLIFSYVIEPHGPDPVYRSLGRGIPASAGINALVNYFDSKFHGLLREKMDTEVKSYISAV